jgi:hypothetical protein
VAWRGGGTAQAYLAGYLIEKSLSLDNVFVFAVIFSAFAIPLRYQHRVLMLGVACLHRRRAGRGRGAVHPRQPPPGRRPRGTSAAPRAHR